MRGASISKKLSLSSLKVQPTGVSEYIFVSSYRAYVLYLMFNGIAAGKSKPAVYEVGSCLALLNDNVANVSIHIVCTTGRQTAAADCSNRCSI